MRAEEGQVHYATVEDTTWPINVGTIEWDLRYGQHPNYVAASVVAAYNALISPMVSATDAIASLRRARAAQRDG